MNPIRNDFILTLVNEIHFAGLSAVPKGDDYFRREILHRLAGLIRKCARRCCNILYGVGAIEINYFALFFAA